MYGKTRVKTRFNLKACSKIHQFYRVLPSFTALPSFINLNTAKAVIADVIPTTIAPSAENNAASALKSKGAKAVKAYITHPVLSGPAIERLNNSDIDEIVVTNSIPLNKEAKKCSKIRVISIASIIAECITRLSNEESLSEMFL